jgi:hypothetical protein
LETYCMHKVIDIAPAPPDLLTDHDAVGFIGVAAIGEEGLSARSLATVLPLKLIS